MILRTYIFTLHLRVDTPNATVIAEEREAAREAAEDDAILNRSRTAIKKNAVDKAIDARLVPELWRLYLGLYGLSESSCCVFDGAT